MITKKVPYRQAHITHIAPQGYGTGSTDTGQPMCVWGAIPGETVRARVIKKRPELLGVAEEIIQPSPLRVAPQEDHFMSCSPWQIVSAETEIQWKKQSLYELYAQYGLVVDQIPLITDHSILHYRNKMEYGFYADGDEMHLALRRRGVRAPIPIQSCILANKSIIDVSHNLLQGIQKTGIPRTSLKSLIVRCNSSGDTLAGLFVTDRERRDYESIFSQTFVTGLEIYYSDKHSPASVPTELLARFGTQQVSDSINGQSFLWSLFSFLQGNLPLFERALARIHEWCADSPSLIDAYAGIGVIGLTSPINRVVLIESNPVSVALAKQYATLSGKRDASIIESLTEKVSGVFTPESTVILDPPRSGLHPDVIKNLLLEKPRRIIYLSCNPLTQARDIATLADAYRLTAVEGYNFFPRTPHIESLALLER
ncbi:class I SAM-dependent RNA methyltransferase [Candidatus Uhrbacteria bacterium]|nr:class I SAM-dependent RNA methyltransferase [Candidatus Uhrbacteria bacterium]